MPFSDPQAERALVGCLLAAPEAVWNCDLHADDFSTTDTRPAFELIGGMIQAGEDVNLITVADRARQLGHDKKGVTSVFLVSCQDIEHEGAFGIHSLIDVIRRTGKRRRLDTIGRLLVRNMREE